MNTATRTEDHVFAEPVASMQEAIRDCLSPEAVAMIAGQLQASIYSFRQPPAAALEPLRQLEWFHDLLMDTIGPDEFNRIWDQLDGGEMQRCGCGCEGVDILIDGKCDVCRGVE